MDRKIIHKFIKVSVFLGLNLFFVHSVYSQESKNAAGAGKETCIMTFSVSGEKEAGTEIVYMDGEKICKHYKGVIKISAESMPYPVETLDIEDENYIIRIDNVKKTGTRIANQKKEILSFPKENQQELMKEVEKGLEPLMPQSPPAVKEGEKRPRHKQIMFFGKPCSVVETSFSKTYIWNTVILRQETYIPFKKVKEIKDIQTHVEISPLKFKVPSDVTIRDITTSEFSQMLQAMMNDLQNRNSPQKASKGGQ